jgi:ketosteroid isomerase-like protein
MQRLESPRRRLVVFVLTILLSILASHGSSTAAKEKAGAPSAEEAVKAVELARAQALLAADTTSLSNMIADDFIEISRLGQIRSKADNMHDISTGELKLTSVHYDSLSVRTYGDVAVLRGIADNTGEFRGFPFSGKIRYTRIFVGRGGHWRAVGMQQTAMP